MGTASAEAAHSFAFAEPLIFLIAAVIAVPVFKRIGLGSILGYLAAGVIVGPVARIVTDAREILHISELGVVLFLFIVGLELRPARLWAMRSDIFGLGLAQMLVTGAALTVVFNLAGWRLEPALVIGFGLAMSSTALGVQMLGERGEIASEYGRKTMAILLFQDIAIVPLLAAVPLLSPAGDSGAGASGWSEAAKALGAVAALVVAGRFLLNPLFRLLARTHASEIMTAAALLVVLGAAALMDFAGLSMAMGAFLAGVLLADSSFRHELEANVEPFRGILLGLFFMAVGMSINLDTIFYSWWWVAAAIPVVMGIKGIILYGLNRLFGASHNDAVRVALLLPQAGEFAFVLFASASAVRALWPSETSLVAGIVTLTIAFTPLAQLLARYLIREAEPEVIEEDFEGAGGKVLIVGFGRFGQIVSQILLARQVDATIIDSNAERIRQAARFGFRIYFGDGTRRDVLRSAGAEKVEIICICVDDREVATHIAEICLAEFPDARIYARSWDRTHTIELLAKGVHFELRETYESALAFGGETLRGLGFDPEDVVDTVADVRRRDAERLVLQRSGDIYSGVNTLPGRVVPEPLTPPTRRNEPDGRAADRQRAESR